MSRGGADQARIPAPSNKIIRNRGCEPLRRRTITVTRCRPDRHRARANGHETCQLHSPVSGWRSPDGAPDRIDPVRDRITSLLGRVRRILRGDDPPDLPRRRGRPGRGRRGRDRLDRSEGERGPRVRRALHRPNIVVIITDQERHPMHWPAGWADANLPNRKRLADHGLSFTRSFCNTAMCSPSRSTFFTGLYPAQHGVTATLTEGGRSRPPNRSCRSASRTWPGCWSRPATPSTTAEVAHEQGRRGRRPEQRRHRGLRVPGLGSRPRAGRTPTRITSAAAAPTSTNASRTRRSSSSAARPPTGTGRSR